MSALEELQSLFREVFQPDVARSFEQGDRGVGAQHVSVLALPQFRDERSFSARTVGQSGRSSVGGIPQNP
jgi:hypothetical protein